MSVGRVKSIKISKNKGKQKEEIEVGFLLENYGLEGDIHSGSVDRQVSILPEECRKQLEVTEVQGFCTRKFQENITISGMELYKCSVGSEIKLGESLVQITSVGKKCFADCPRVKVDESCVLKTQCIYARVVNSGKVRVGDIVKIK